MPEQEQWTCSELEIDPMDDFLVCTASAPLCRMEAPLGHLDVRLCVRYSALPYEEMTAEVAIIIKAKGYEEIQVAPDPMRVRFDDSAVMTQPFGYFLRNGDVFAFNYEETFKPTPLDRIQSGKHKLFVEINLKRPRMGRTLLTFSLIGAGEAIAKARQQVEQAPGSFWDI